MSRFTYRNLYALKTSEKSFDTPMACIAHLDMDAFFAQVEQVRLGLAPDTPVACRQWDGLIAVGYPARKHGITRHMRADEAQKLCPELVMAHAASFKRGEGMWKYHPNPTADNYKISLDPYRHAGKKVLEIVKRFSSIVEKASVDESYLDLGPRIFNEMMLSFPQLQLLDNDLDNFLPSPPRPHELNIRGFTWEGLGVLEIVTDASRFDPETRVHDDTLITDWDDLVLLIGARIAKKMRETVFEELGYTCSAGVARCRSVAKLASAENKPNNQTIVRAGALRNFLRNKSITDIGGMGGKLGEEVLEKLGFDKESKGNIEQIQALSRQQLQQKLQNASLTDKVYLLSHGCLYRGLKTRIDLKSMLSAKNFSRVPLKDRNEAEMWLIVFAGELAMRIVEHEKELGVCSRPRTVSLQHTRYNPTVRRSRQQEMPLVHTNKLKDELFTAGKRLLKQIESEPANDAYPISLLSLSVSGFVALPAGASIGHFFKTVTAEARQKAAEESTKSQAQQTKQLWNKPKEKKEVVGKDITQFFMKKPKNEEEKTDEGIEKVGVKPATSDELDYQSSSLFIFSDDELDEYMDTFTCERCNKKYPIDEEMEHNDWHLAVELSKASRPEPRPLKVVKPKGKKNTRQQAKLAF